MPNWRSNFWAVSWSTGGIITPAFAINAFSLVSPTIRKTVRQRHSSWGLEDILEEFLGGFLCGIQVVQVELVEDGFLQEKLFTSFPSDTCVPPVTMKSLPERSGIPSTDRSGVGGRAVGGMC